MLHFIKFKYVPFHSMWLSQKDCLGFIQSSLEVKLSEKYVCCYTISNNSSRIFDLENSIKMLNYKPKDKSENFLDLRIEKKKCMEKIYKFQKQ